MFVVNVCRVKICTQIIIEHLVPFTMQKHTCFSLVLAYLAWSIFSYAGLYFYIFFNFWSREEAFGFTSLKWMLHYSFKACNLLSRCSLLISLCVALYFIWPRIVPFGSVGPLRGLSLLS